MAGYPTNPGQEVMANSMPVVWASDQTPVANPSLIYSGQLTLSTSAAALPNHALMQTLTITAGNTNTGKVFIGPSGVTSSTGYVLSAGGSVSLTVSNSNVIYVLGANTSDTISWIAN
jgi:hypothetical protein